MTSLFTNDIKIIKKTIRECQRSLFLRDIPILLGGITASLLGNDFNFNNVYIFKGYSKELDMNLPDYSINYALKKPWDSFAYIFTQRGCINSCDYCMVHKLEPKIWINPKWKEFILLNKKGVVISDNNILITDKRHSSSVLKYLKEIKIPVLFNNGIYAKAINKKNAPLLAGIKYMRSGLRTAFDRMEDDGYYQRGMQLLLDNGVNLKKDSYTYILFNFQDTPQEAYYRAKQAWHFGSLPYLMPYRPFTIDKKGTYIGKHWTLNLVRAFKNWGELYGFNRGDGTFESWCKSDKTKINLGNVDWDKWYFQKEKF